MRATMLRYLCLNKFNGIEVVHPSLLRKTDKIIISAHKWEMCDFLNWVSNKEGGYAHLSPDRLSELYLEFDKDYGL